MDIPPLRFAVRTEYTFILRQVGCRELKHTYLLLRVVVCLFAGWGTGSIHVTMSMSINELADEILALMLMLILLLFLMLMLPPSTYLVHALLTILYDAHKIWPVRR